ncbi:MAG TPA: hypothetical protein VF711_06990, partial [Acidimicrobiales bacterium]
MYGSAAVVGRMMAGDQPPGADPAGDPTGLLVIRAWVERGSSEPLRAQIRLSTDVSAGFERTLTVARAD